jgi:hypothetical protein
MFGHQARNFQNNGPGSGFNPSFQVETTTFGVQGDFCGPFGQSSPPNNPFAFNFPSPSPYGNNGNIFPSFAQSQHHSRPNPNLPSIQEKGEEAELGEEAQIHCALCSSNVESNFICRRCFKSRQANLRSYQESKLELFHQKSKQELEDIKGIKEQLSIYER